MNFEELFDLYEESQITKCVINNGMLDARVEYEVEDDDTRIVYDINISNTISYTVRIHKYNWNRIVVYDIVYANPFTFGKSNLDNRIKQHVLGASSLCKMITNINNTLFMPNVSYDYHIECKKLVRNSDSQFMNLLCCVLAVITIFGMLSFIGCGANISKQ